MSRPDEDIFVGVDGRCRFGRGLCRCALGRAGVVANKREGDGATPAGAWPLRRVLYRPDREDAPRSVLPAAPISRATGWCDDPAHGDYNRQVALPFAAGHEKMWREDRLYDLVVVLGHNDDPPVPGAGSAVFLHLARPDWAPTAGCIAFARDDLLAILRRVGIGSRVVVGP